METRSIVRGVRLSADKGRLVADMIRGKKVDQAINILTFTPKKAAGIIKGSGTPNKDKVAKITQAQLREIAQKKMVDLNAATLDGAIKIIEGTARSMGITVQ